MRVDIQVILADPVLRERLAVEVIVATQAREGITTSRSQARRAYRKVVGERARRDLSSARRG